MTSTTDRTRLLSAVALASALALGLAGCGGTGAQTGPYIEEPTAPPQPDDDGTSDNLDDDGDRIDDDSDDENDD